MGKKGSKRKTRWRTLSIGEITTEAYEAKLPDRHHGCFLSGGAPPGEEDEEEGLRKDYVKSQDKETNTHAFDRNGQAGYKPRRGGITTTSSGSTSGPNNVSRLHRDESTGSPSQPKIIFNEDEYTRITTPRQDVLFKKGYLSRKKPWTGGNASTSATPSTAESQSASHSTADGSETTEDQQLLDRDTGVGEYPPMVDPATQLGYGTCYDHATGYCYEYPVMLIGPASVPQVGPSVLATVPCGPVPLRPIEWINPVFMSKLANQPYCLMDYQTSQNTETVTITEEQNGTMVTAETSNGVWNENGSCSGSVAGEIEEQTVEMDNAIAEQQTKEQLSEEQQQCPEQHQHFEGFDLENSGVTTTIDQFLEPPILMQEPAPIHMSHVVPAAGHSYMYPGHYMFGLPLVDVNGVTVQSGPLVRTMDVTAMTMACTKRKKKRKKRKQRRPILGNTEDEEEGEYSSECDNDISSSRLPWSECPTTITTTTAVNRPLNPECQEFQLRPALQSRILSNPVSTSIVTEEVTTLSANNTSSDVSSCIVKTELVPSRETSEKVSNTVQDQTNQEDTLTVSNSEQFVTKHITSENIHQPTVSTGHESRNTEVNVRTNHPFENTDAVVTSCCGNETVTVTRNDISIDHEEANENDIAKNGSNGSTSVDAKCELFQSNGTDIDIKLHNNPVEYVEIDLTNGKTNFESYNSIPVQSSVPTSRSPSPQTDIAFSEKSHQIKVVSNVILTNTNAEDKEKEGKFQRLQHCNTSLVRTTSSLAQPRKYKKSAKLVRELTPGRDLDYEDTRSDIENNKVLQRFEAIELSEDTHAVDCECVVANHKLNEINREVPYKENSTSETRDDNKINKTNQGTIESSINEDSGFESQTRLSEYPITNAVTEWLRRANSPDLFLTSASISDNDTDEDDDEDMDGKPPKNLQGNPMPALSVNSSADNSVTTTLSRTASCGEFAKTNNNNNNNNYYNIKIIDRVETSGASAVGRRKRDAMSMTRRKSATKKIDKRSSRNVDEKVQNRLVSSLVSCHRMENLVTTVRLKNPPKNNVGEVCEFTQEDSVAGMRVALSSRINSKKVSVRRTKTSRRINRDLVENIDIRMRRIDDAKNSEDGNKVINDATVSVRTFEKGEIIVSEDGKLLPTSSYEPISSDDCNISATMIANHATDNINENVKMRERERRSSSENSDENVMMSSVSIEEPDVLECWEAETIEPVITPKRMLQSAGIQCEGEAVEEDNFEIKKITMEHVRKYYRLARDNGIEEESSELSAPSLISVSKPSTVPNNSEKMIECFYGIEEIPIIVPNKSRNILEDEKIPIDEAFEAYESCYIAKSPFLASFDSKMFKKQRPFYGQNGEGPIPCRAVCCNIQ